MENIFVFTLFVSSVYAIFSTLFLVTVFISMGVYLKRKMEKGFKGQSKLVDIDAAKLASPDAMEAQEETVEN